MILDVMLDRLYRSLVNGPCLNARPHRSRQRLDVTMLAAFASPQSGELLARLLGPDAAAEVPARVPVFRMPDPAPRELTPAMKEAKAKSEAQESLLHKLREIAEDASDYEHDHGESALSIGFPILHVPPRPERTTRIVAPLGFIPINLAVRLGARKGVTISANADGIDRVVPNPALLAWIRQQTGQDVLDLFSDEEGNQPWQEVSGLVEAVSKALDIPNPPAIGEAVELTPVPKAEDMGDDPSILPAAVLGLFPLANQGLLSDTRWMVSEESKLVAPVATFLRPEAIGPSREDAVDGGPEAPAAELRRAFQDEHLVTYADPCQAAAVHAAAAKPVVVIHGPPGTGKSQTITNIIGSHLARGERVLFVCDKRTALDVVKYRLDAAGLGHLCALIHDPKREQKELYMSLRQRLDNLVDEPVIPSPARELTRINEQLEKIHAELRGYQHSLHGSSGEGESSFHDLFGQWLLLNPPEALLTPTASAGQITLQDAENAQASVEEITTRAAQSLYGQNPWRQSCGWSVGQFLSATPQDLAEHAGQVITLASTVDQFAHESLPVLGSEPLAPQAQARRGLAAALREVSPVFRLEAVAQIQAMDQASLERLAHLLDQVEGEIQKVRQAPLDTGLFLSAPPSAISIGQAAGNLAALEAFEPVCAKWYRFLFAGKAKAAKDALQGLGLTPSPESVASGIAYLRGVQARQKACGAVNVALGTEAARWMDDAEVLGLYDFLTRAIRGLSMVVSTPELAPHWDMVRAYLASKEHLDWLAYAFELSASRADAIATWEEHAAASGLLCESERRSMGETMRSNGSVTTTLEELKRLLPTLEHVLRLEAALAELPAAVRGQMEHIAMVGASHEEASAALRKLALANAIRQRLGADSALQHISSERVDSLLHSYIQLQEQKRVLTVQETQSWWQTRARQRLLAGTGTQMNSQGANLKTRLLTRGARALKLRKMIEVGQAADGGDPLYDLCPVWMSSPNTVAQIFPRTALFDVVVFDEASQCRLEEALPVLLRARRVVVAGDPKQLPPTRFFESGVVDSSDDEIESEEDAFQAQQADTEDLLGAALNLSVHEAYLDVHYRSSNAALIEFSNKSFYKGRLQAIPAHPNSLAPSSPLKLVQVGGLYKDRQNEREAQEVCRIVKELLNQPTPPTIGIACFNLTQRELILETLDAEAEADPDFAAKLADARKRRGRQSFEGLFVKNLENVQGDERDHIIISTTFGVNPEGKFRRGFGPLSATNGGRRLNVLVTRARDQVHIVTSIPRSEYAAAVETPEGTQPNGRILLYQYLHYAEKLETEFKQKNADLQEAAKELQGKMVELQNSYPSVAALGCGRDTNQHLGLGGFVHWGNDGFCVDVALNHPEKPLYVTAGLLCDFNRYGKAPDPVDWEAFRHFILERLTKWKLCRIWSPSAFRDIHANRHQILRKHQECMGAIGEGPAG
ncbi:MAG: AAA domain-containing protein [Candidatus Methylacidiphilales bacterium]|nr:AAA domain-containing protein [Candidatus Methylacidiphilales bacterium]